jgi:hypothetical protein
MPRYTIHAQILVAQTLDVSDHAQTLSASSDVSDNAQVHYSCPNPVPDVSLTKGRMRIPDLFIIC